MYAKIKLCKMLAIHTFLCYTEEVVLKNEIRKDATVIFFVIGK